MLTAVFGGRIVDDRLLETAARSSARATGLSLYDPLTSLPNRTLLVDRIHEGLTKTARTPDWALAVLMVDLDGFSEVNDTLGHAVGDEVLTEVARRICGKVRTSDTVAPIVVGKERLELTASVGVAVFPDDGTTADELLQQADHALMTSKSAGPDRVRSFTRTLQESAETRRRLVADLREALPQGQLEVHDQPIIDLRTGEVHHAEALVRWRHPTRGMVSPAAFIPIAETTGLIHEIGEFVFPEACTQSLITMAHDMSMKVVTEGVAPEQQRDLLLQMGCDDGQGFLFAKPMSATDFDAFLARGAVRPTPSA
jgi:predicted signal transduction protein with EAL and GGDEF domain